jgi:hypothetical protein
MDTTNTNNNSNVVELKTYKNQKREQKQQYLFIDYYYQHISLSIALKLLAISTRNPFTRNVMYLGVDARGSLAVFDEGEESLWYQITQEEFREKVDDENKKAQGTNLEEEIQKS